MQKMVQDNYTLKFRRDTKERWEQYNPVLGEGEPGYDLTKKQFKVGDGVSAWNNLNYHAGNAFDVARQNGFVGTEAEWLLSLKGEKGDKGDKGDTGLRGPAGTNGTDGTDGTNGKDGAIQYGVATSSADGLMSSSHFNALDTSTVEGYPNTLVLRDSQGRAQFNNPVNAKDAATKSWVENQISAGAPAQDTGWRLVNDLVNTQTIAAKYSGVRICRKGDLVQITGEVSCLNSSTLLKNSLSLIVNIPTGFRFPSGVTVMGSGYTNQSAAKPLNISAYTSTSINHMGDTRYTTETFGTSLIYFSMMWFTRDVFPVTLPGTPV